MERTDKDPRQRAHAEGVGERLPAEALKNPGGKHGGDHSGNHDEQPVKRRFEFSVPELVAFGTFVGMLAILFYRLMNG